MSINSNEYQIVWSQIVSLATAVGDVRARVTRLERDQARNWHPPIQPTASRPAEDTEAPSLSQRISRLREMLSVVITIYRIWRMAPWGIILFGIVAGVRWAWPPVSRFFGLS